MNNENAPSSDIVAYSIERHDYPQYEMRVRAQFSLKKDKPRLPWKQTMAITDDSGQVMWNVVKEYPKNDFPRQWIESPGGERVVHFSYGGTFHRQISILDSQGRLMATITGQGMDTKYEYEFGRVNYLALRILEDQFGKEIGRIRTSMVHLSIPKWDINSPSGDVKASFREGPTKDAAHVSIDARRIEPLLAIGAMVGLGVPIYLSMTTEKQYASDIKGWPDIPL